MSQNNGQSPEVATLPPPDFSDKLLVEIHPVPFKIGEEHFYPESEVRHQHPRSIISCFELKDQEVWVLETLSGTLIGLTNREFLQKYKELL